MEEPLLTCSICLNELENNNKCITNCEHSYCNVCLHNWFNQGHISCPMCRGDVKNFIHKNEVNHVIKVRPTTNDPVLIENFRRVYNQNVYLRFIILIQILYTFYSMYEKFAIQDDYFKLKELYDNCTETNDSLNIRINSLTESHMTDNIYNDNIYDLMTQYSIDYISKCFYPLKYINHCTN